MYGALRACSDYPDWIKPGQWITSSAGAALNRTGLTQTFASEWAGASTDITADGGGGPWYIDDHVYGVAQWQGVGGIGSTFIASGGALTIRLQNPGAAWTCGGIRTVNAAGAGFAQARGLFEARMRMPAGVGSWPAFWLIGANKISSPGSMYAEVDVVEAYGDAPATYGSVSVHKWAPGYHWVVGFTDPAPADVRAQFNTYGIEVTPDWIIAYFNDVERARYPVYPEAAQPLYMILSHGMDKDSPVDTTPRDFQIEWVRAWTR